MTKDRKFGRWTLSEDDLTEMNSVKARDLITRCFLEAQKETFYRVRERAGVSHNEDSVKKSIDNVVKMAFKSTGGDYDNPSKESLMKVVGQLAENAASFGTPEDIIDHHKGLIEKIFSRL